MREKDLALSFTILVAANQTEILLEEIKLIVIPFLMKVHFFCFVDRHSFPTDNFMEHDFSLPKRRRECADNQVFKNVLLCSSFQTEIKASTWPVSICGDLFL